MIGIQFGIQTYNKYICDIINTISYGSYQQ